MKQFLQMLTSKESLSQADMTGLAKELFREDISDSEIAGLIIALKTKGETAVEITGLVEALRAQAMPFKSRLRGVIDNCGTGGDGSQSFNVSTASAFVLAGAGIRVAKHGNRSVSSRTGSADVLEQLGVNLKPSPERAEEMLEELGITFLFAPYVHPNIKRIMKVRQDLKIPTIFNMIGPLTNPVDLDHQLLGIYNPAYIDLFADVLKRLGRKRAIVVTGAGNMDEASLEGENRLAIVEGGEIRKAVFLPEEVGLSRYDNRSIKGGDAAENADILLRILKGEKGAFRDTVLLNAGLGIYAAGKTETIEGGISLAKESIDSGSAHEKLQRLVEKSKEKEAV